MAKVMKKASAVKSRRIGGEFGTELWEDIANVNEVKLMKGGFPISIAKARAKIERCDVDVFVEAAKAAFKTLQKQWLKYDYCEDDSY